MQNQGYASYQILHTIERRYDESLVVCFNQRELVQGKCSWNPFFIMSQPNSCFKAAWGMRTKKANTMMIQSFEAGVLFLPKFIVSNKLLWPYEVLTIRLNCSPASIILMSGGNLFFLMICLSSNTRKKISLGSSTSYVDFKVFALSL